MTRSIFLPGGALCRRSNYKESIGTMPKTHKRAEDFMDRWLEENVKPTHLRRSAELVAKALSKRCVRDAQKKGIPVDELEDVVVDVAEAIIDEIRIVTAKPAS